MFSSVNFLFLTSLAIISWVILLYLKHIEDQRLQEINVDFSMERAFDESTLRNTTIPCRGEGYEIYLNLLCVFACIYALAKITSLTENYIYRHVQARMPHPQHHQQPHSPRMPRMPHRKAAPKTARPACTRPVQNSAPSPPKPLSERVMLQMTYREQQQQQECELCQAGCASKHSSCTSFLLLNAEETAAAAVAAAEAAIKQQQQQQQQQQRQPQSNIFISNRHFHLNHGQIYVNEGNLKLHFQNFNKDVGGGGGGGGFTYFGDGAAQNEPDMAAAGDFSQVWRKYLEMQKYAIKKPATPLAASAQMANTVPLVVSTEDLMRRLL